MAECNKLDHRLDKYIKLKYGKNIPQALIEKSLRNKDITVNGAKAKASTRVTDEDDIQVSQHLEKLFTQIFCEAYDDKNSNPKARDYSKHLARFKSWIIYEDSDIIVLNKPSGIAMQLGTKIKIAIDVVAKEYCQDARIVHRLDKDTSGVTIIAKNLQTARWLTREFQCKNVEKQYYAMVTPRIDADVGSEITIDRPIIKLSDKSYVDYEKGKKAVTIFKVERHVGHNKTLVLAKPLTGRMHQIRVHLASIEHNILGDNKYLAIDAGNRYKRFMLHAYSIRFKMGNGKYMHFKAELDDDWTKDIG